MTRTEHEALTKILGELQEAYYALPGYQPAAVVLSRSIDRLASVLDNAADPCTRCASTEPPPDTERAARELEAQGDPAGAERVRLEGEGFEVHAPKPARDDVTDDSKTG